MPTSAPSLVAASGQQLPLGDDHGADLDAAIAAPWGPRAGPVHLGAAIAPAIWTSTCAAMPSGRKRRAKRSKK